MEEELLTFSEHPSSPPVFSGVRVTRSLVLYVCFVDRCLSFCTFSFDHCIVCSSSIIRILVSWNFSYSYNKIHCIFKTKSAMREAQFAPIGIPNIWQKKLYYQTPNKNVKKSSIVVFISFIITKNDLYSLHHIHM